MKGDKSIPGQVAGPVTYKLSPFSSTGPFPPKVASLPNKVQPLSSGSSSSQKLKNAQLGERAQRALQASADFSMERWNGGSMGEYLIFALKQPEKSLCVLSSI